MRIRNVKNKDEILKNSSILINNPTDYIGKWNTIFNNDNPIYIEIGMGKGKFIMENARMYPNINFIGIERFDSILARAVQKIDITIPNLLIIRMDATNIENVFKKEISRIYLNFSDPWPKKRHQERRLTSPTFLKKYESIFKDKKEIYMKTDNEMLFTYSLESLSKNNYYLEDINLDLHKNSSDLIITTEYEDKFVSKGINIYSVKAISKDV